MKGACVREAGELNSRAPADSGRANETAVVTRLDRLDNLDVLLRSTPKAAFLQIHKPQEPASYISSSEKQLIAIATTRTALPTTPTQVQ